LLATNVGLIVGFVVVVVVAVVAVAGVAVVVFDGAR
jgi:hypothetical protein